MKLKKILLWTLAIITLIISAIYLFTPQERWVPTYLKQRVFSCYKEGEEVPVISSDPQCCIGLKEGSIERGDLPVGYILGAFTCTK